MDWCESESDDSPIPYGAIFGQPKPGSRAAQAGIEAGDAIIATAKPCAFARLRHRDRDSGGVVDVAARLIFANQS
jgi:hypothetical protein